MQQKYFFYGKSNLILDTYTKYNSLTPSGQNYWCQIDLIVSKLFMYQYTSFTGNQGLIEKGFPCQIV